MSFNCLNCQVLQRTDSDCSTRFINKTLCCKVMVDRSWSGNLTPAAYYEKVGRSSRMIKNKPKQDHRRIGSTGAVEFEENLEPKLVRSGGMRRDWSFECLDHVGGAGNRRDVSRLIAN
ncbi:hypothetical protein Ancab_015737 [Ancistrocladus abbreviatus]